MKNQNHLCRILVLQGPFPTAKNIVVSQWKIRIEEAKSLAWREVANFSEFFFSFFYWAPKTGTKNGTLTPENTEALQSVSKPAGVLKKSIASYFQERGEREKICFWLGQYISADRSQSVRVWDLGSTRVCMHWTSEQQQEVDSLLCFSGRLPSSISVVAAVRLTQFRSGSNFQTFCPHADWLS